MSNNRQSSSPIPGLALDELFPQEEHFIHHQSNIHGVDHVARVICHSIDLVKEHGPAEYLAPAWAAAFLHDLARRTDGVCNRHGQWAVDDCWDLHVERFRRAGVGPEWDERIKAAVINHCDRDNLEKSDPAWRLAAFLKDADALDRYRLNESPDPRMLRFEHADEVYFRAEKLEYETYGCADGMEVWAARQVLDTDAEVSPEFAHGEELPAVPHIDPSHQLDLDIGPPGGGKESHR